MTRILHTADLHLAGDEPDRWEALDAVLEAAGDRDADAVLVAGDLLDRGEDHAELRARVRERLDGAPAPVLVLPGNHDREAYAPGQDWGDGVRLLLDEPVSTARVGDVRVLGVPFPSRPVPFAGLRRRVVAAIDELAGDAPRLLAMHGTLVDASAPHIQAESRDDEPDDRYFSIRTGELEGLDVDYVALGHYHQHDVRRAGRVPVAYAGSPSPVGSHAWGRRSAVLVDLDAGDADRGDGGAGRAEAEVDRVVLPVPYSEKIVRWLTPFREEEELEELADELRDRADGACSMTVVLNGILAGIEEADLRATLERLGDELSEGFARLEFDRDAVGLDPARADLFRDFRRRLEERASAGDGPDEGLRHRTLEIAARALKQA